MGRYKQLATEWGFNIDEQREWIEHRILIENVTPKERLRIMAIDGGEKPGKNKILPDSTNKNGKK